MRGLPLEPTTVARVDDYILAAVLLLLVLVGYNATHVGRLFRSFFTDIWSVRRRDNVFDEHVAIETQALLLLMFLTSVLEGLILYRYLPDRGTETLQRFGLCVGISMGFNLFSIAGCRVLGYVFTDSQMALQWRRGLYATQSMLGILLIVPAIMVLIDPQEGGSSFILGSVFYIAARLLYIIKGIRIFYTEFYSWVYFILYLCTLEIIPLLVIGRYLYAQ